MSISFCKEKTNHPDNKSLEKRKFVSVTSKGGNLTSKGEGFRDFSLKQLTLKSFTGRTHSCPVI